MGLCGRYHEPYTRARKSKTKMRQAVEKKKIDHYEEGTTIQRLLKIRVLNWFIIFLDTAIVNVHAALSHQAKRLGNLRSPETMRKEIVEYFTRNPYYSDGFHLSEHLADDEFSRWDDYITHMARDYAVCSSNLV